MNSPRIKFLVTLTMILLTVPLLLTACAGTKTTSTTINVTMLNHNWTTDLKAKLPEFEKATGLKVNISTYGDTQISDLYNVKLNSKSNEFDVMMYRPLNEGKLFAKNKWLEPLDSRVNADKNWDWSDFQAGPVKAVSNDKGVPYGVPAIIEQTVLYYNKAILAAAGVQPPKTLDELKAAAAKINNPGKGVYGFVSRGQKGLAVSTFASYLYSFGGEYDRDGKAMLNTAQAKNAYEYYSGLLKDYGPPGTTEMSWPQALPIFAQGKAAFYTEVSSLWSNFSDKTKSSIIDNVGYSTFPAGPAGSKPTNVTSWALGINSFSQNKDNAWKFVEWVTSKETTLALQNKGTPLARTSVWNDPAGVAGFPVELKNVILETTKTGIGQDRPRAIKVAEARDIAGTPIVVGISGGDLKSSIDKAQTDLQNLFDQEKQ